MTKTAQTYLVTKLKMEITWFGVEPEINTLSIVSDDVLSTWILVVSSAHKFLHATEKTTSVNLKYQNISFMKN